MRTKRTLTIATILTALAALIAFGISRGTQSARAESEVSVSGAFPTVAALAAPTPNYTATDASGNRTQTSATVHVRRSH